MADDMVAKITGFKQSSVPTGTGQQKDVIDVTYTVGAHGPFVERFDKSEFDPVKVKAKLAEFAQKIKQAGV